MQKISRLVNIMGSAVLASGLAACASRPPVNIPENTTIYDLGVTEVADYNDGIPYVGEGRKTSALTTREDFIPYFDGKTLLGDVPRHMYGFEVRVGKDRSGKIIDWGLYLKDYNHGGFGGGGGSGGGGAGGSGGGAGGGGGGGNPNQGGA